MFANCLGVIEAVAKLGENATIGQVQRMNSHLSRGQVERVLKQLAKEDYVGYFEFAHGRTGKKVWHIRNRCHVNIAIVAGYVVATDGE